MRRDNALGAAGGAGGEHHAGRVQRTRRTRQVVRRLRFHRGPVAAVGRHHFGRPARQPTGPYAVTDDEPRTRLTEEVRQPPVRERRVQQRVRGPRLQRRQQRHHQLRPALQAHRDHRARLGAPRHQQPRQPVGPLVQFPVRDPRPAEDQRRRVRHQRRPLLEQLVQTTVGGGGAGGVLRGPGCHGDRSQGCRTAFHVPSSGFGAGARRPRGAGMPPVEKKCTSRMRVRASVPCPSGAAGPVAVRERRPAGDRRCQTRWARRPVTWIWSMSPVPGCRRKRPR